MKFKKFIFYDYETYGLNVSLDKISQFACIQTDENFNILSKPISILGSLPLDYFPNLDSIFINKILPQYSNIYGMNEYYLARNIYKIFTQKNVCILGYNNINFDNLITRNIFYRNFLDPYEWEWKNGNFTGDVLSILRVFYVLEPFCLKWFYKHSGAVSFKLSHITEKNSIVHFKKHDALSDIFATIEILKILKSYNEKLFFLLLELFNKEKILNFVTKNQNKPFFYISSIFGALNFNIGVVSFLMFHPTNKNIILVYDLKNSPKDALFSIKNFSKNCNILKKLFKIGILSVYINKNPIFLSYNMINTKNCIRLKINYIFCQKNFFILKKFYNIIFFLRKILQIKSQICINKNVDLQLYKNFLTFYDKKILYNFFLICSYNIPEITFQTKFFDSRLSELFFRMRARNFFITLNDLEKKKWKKYCLNVINNMNFSEYIHKINLLSRLFVNKSKKIFLIKNFLLYIQKKILKIQNL
ncbi:exodeoxyribonuclease I [Buchnera aphidicola]|uniref:exodeoxyribonuclease I n=1 Tax=Buchnera aphidicola TaxID=9 RepID=UPI0031B73DB7